MHGRHNGSASDLQAKGATSSRQAAADECMAGSRHTRKNGWCTRTWCILHVGLSMVTADWPIQRAPFSGRQPSSGTIHGHMQQASRSNHRPTVALPLCMPVPQCDGSLRAAHVQPMTEYQVRPAGWCSVLQLMAGGGDGCDGCSCRFGCWRRCPTCAKPQHQHHTTGTRSGCHHHRTLQRMLRRASGGRT